MRPRLVTSLTVMTTAMMTVNMSTSTMARFGTQHRLHLRAWPVQAPRFCPATRLLGRRSRSKTITSSTPRNLATPAGLLQARLLVLRVATHSLIISMVIMITSLVGTRTLTAALQQSTIAGSMDPTAWPMQPVVPMRGLHALSQSASARLTACRLLLPRICKSTEWAHLQAQEPLLRPTRVLQAAEPLLWRHRPSHRTSWSTTRRP